MERPCIQTMHRAAAAAATAAAGRAGQQLARSARRMPVRPRISCTPAPPGPRAPPPAGEHMGAAANIGINKVRSASFWEDRGRTALLLFGRTVGGLREGWRPAPHCLLCRWRRA